MPNEYIQKRERYSEHQNEHLNYVGPCFLLAFSVRSYIVFKNLKIVPFPVVFPSSYEAGLGITYLFLHYLNDFTGKLDLQGRLGNSRMKIILMDDRAYELSSEEKLPQKAVIQHLLTERCRRYYVQCSFNIRDPVVI